MTLPEAIAAPRASQRNTAAVTAEAAVHRCLRHGPQAVRTHLSRSGDALTSAAEIGAVAALEFLPGGAILAAAEPADAAGEQPEQSTDLVALTPAAPQQHPRGVGGRALK